MRLLGLAAATIACGAPSSGEAGLDVARLSADAWDRAGAAPYFELHGAASTETSERIAAPTRIWGQFLMQDRYVWAAVEPSDAPDAAGRHWTAVVVGGDLWAPRGLEGPRPLDLRAYRVSAADAEAFLCRFAEVSRQRFQARAVAAPPPPMRRSFARGWVAWQIPGGPRPIVHVDLAGPPLAAEDAQHRVTYELASGFVQAASRMRSESAVGAAERVLTGASHWVGEPFDHVVDWFACHGGRIDPSAKAGIEAWAAAPSISELHAAERQARSARAIAAGSIGSVAIGSDAWAATFRQGVVGAGPRWRTHFAEAADPARHRAALLGQLRLGYPESMDAAAAMRFFGYCADPTGLDALAAVPPDARSELARGLIDAGHESRGVDLLADVVAAGAAEWCADAAWWGRSGWYVRARDDLDRVSGSHTRGADWRRLVETTADPFVAVTALDRTRSAGATGGATQLLHRRVQECISRAMALPGGEIAAAAALDYLATGGHNARTWLASAEVAAQFHRCAAAIQTDCRLPPAERAAIHVAIDQAVRDGSAPDPERR